MLEIPAELRPETRAPTTPPPPAPAGDDPPAPPTPTAPSAAHDDGVDALAGGCSVGGDARGGTAWAGWLALGLGIGVRRHWRASRRRLERRRR
jgi:hypothetical protein